MVVVRGLKECVASNAVLCACDVGDGLSNNSERNRTFRKRHEENLFRSLSEENEVHCLVRSSRPRTASFKELWKKRECNAGRERKGRERGQKATVP